MRRIRRLWENTLWWFSSEESRGLYEFGQHLFAVSLVLIEMSHRFHDVFPWVPQWDELYISTIGLGLLLIVLTWTMRLIFRHSPKTSRLYLDITTGRLRARTLGEANVALRHQTMERILKGFMEEVSGEGRSALLFRVSRDIGNDFATTFLNHHDLQGEDALDRLLLYDSSSGMGLFKLKEYTTDHIVITVWNSFTESRFSTGISGVCSQVTGIHATDVKSTQIGPRHFKFEIAFDLEPRI